MRTRKQMALEYGVTVKTFMVWVKERVCITLSACNICPINQQKIYEILGKPPQKA